MKTPARAPIRWVLIPAILTLAVTAIRLYGELEGLDPAWFGTAPGGSAAPMTESNPEPLPSWIGISWLMPIMGGYFAFRLCRNGAGPDSRLKALLTPLVALAAVFALVALMADQMVGAEPSNIFYAFFGGAMVLVIAGAVFCRWAWPALAKLTLVYALLARLPVVALTYVLVPMDKGTHYEKLAPMAPATSDLMRAHVLSLAQVGMWVPLTMVTGAALGGIVALVTPRRSP